MARRCWVDSDRMRAQSPKGTESDFGMPGISMIFRYPGILSLCSRIVIVDSDTITISEQLPPSRTYLEVQPFARKRGKFTCYCNRALRICATNSPHSGKDSRRQIGRYALAQLTSPHSEKGPN